MIGLVFNGLFAADYIIGLDGVSTGSIGGGWLNHNYAQLYIQVAYVVAVTAYSFVVSAILAYAIDKIPGLHLRASAQAELIGMDEDQLGEFAYDYVEVRRDYLAWTSPQHQEGQGGPEDIPMRDRHGIAAHCDLLEGKEPESQNGDSEGGRHTGIQGDRHAVAAEDREKEKAGRTENGSA